MKVTNGLSWFILASFRLFGSTVYFTIHIGLLYLWHVEVITLASQLVNWRWWSSRTRVKAQLLPRLKNSRNFCERKWRCKYSNERSGASVETARENEEKRATGVWGSRASHARITALRAFRKGKKTTVLQSNCVPSIKWVNSRFALTVKAFAGWSLTISGLWLLLWSRVLLALTISAWPD